MLYGPRDPQRREEPVLRRVRAERARIPIGPADPLWTRGHVDDIARGVVAALDTPTATGQAINLGESTTYTLRGWFTRILRAAGADTELVTVPDHALPADLTLTRAPAQHLLVSCERARRLLGWRPDDPAARIADSVRWHLANPPPGPGWSEADTATDDAALALADHPPDRGAAR